MDERYRPAFPTLSGVKGKQTSEPDRLYNCIAWAFQDNRRKWWPSPRAYWPMPLERSWSVLRAFEEWFRQDGWVETANQLYEIGVEKIALYAKLGTPTHAARLLPSGVWSSKLGDDIDLVHSLSELEGPLYGAVLSVYRKQLTA